MLLDAAKRGNVALMGEIMASNGDVFPNPQDGLGNTPLIYSIIGNHYDTASILLKDLGADPDAQNYSGDTALHLACKEDKRDLISLLIEHGASPNIPNKRNRKAIDLAKDGKVREILTIVQYSAIDEEDIVDSDEFDE
eukprot:TRINITY_DN1250_c0_g1_i2.p1 TRINITY_DN1250_c0_g1~~TRINITY_DN1250_c0_g1_i2.p1  ORF type:complete len:138 (-),score=44.25 TRINITY_DN1250_c0_g1_i2:36-449(-)